jgi:hypothetical protein
MTITRLSWILVTALIALHGAGAAAAVEFQLLDRSSDAHTSPEAAQSLPGCFVDASNTLGGHLTATELLLDSSSHSRVAGADCDNSASASAQQSLLVTLIGPPGSTTQICYVTRFSAATPADGASVSASADVGGNPFTDPGGVYLNAVPVSVVQRHFATNEEDSAATRGVFTATVGDQIRVATGTRAAAAVTGSGAASGDASILAAIYIGECPRDHAPAASPLGLGALALALPALGALLLRRRQRAAR